MARGAVSSHVAGCQLQCTATQASCLQYTRRAGCSSRLLTICLAALTWLRAPSAHTWSAVGFNAQPHRLRACSARGVPDAAVAYSPYALQHLLGSGRRQLTGGRLSAVAYLPYALQSYLARGAVSPPVVGCRLQCIGTPASCLQCTRRAGCSSRLLTVCLSALTWLVAPSAHMWSAAGFNAQLHGLRACRARGVLDAAVAHLPSASQLLLGAGRRQLTRGRLSASMHSYTGFVLAVHAACWMQ